MKTNLIYPKIKMNLTYIRLGKIQTKNNKLITFIICTGYQILIT